MRMVVCLLWPRVWHFLNMFKKILLLRPLHRLAAELLEVIYEEG